MQSACFQMPNPNLIPADSTTPLNGLVVYQKQYNQNYPFAFGPRLGVAYQIDSKTVFRAGGGICLLHRWRQRRLVGYRCRLLCPWSPGGNRPGPRRIRRRRDLFQGWKSVCSRQHLRQRTTHGPPERRRLSRHRLPVRVAARPLLSRVRANRSIRRSLRSTRARDGCRAFSNGASGCSAKSSPTC